MRKLPYEPIRTQIRLRPETRLVVDRVLVEWSERLGRAATLSEICDRAIRYACETNDDEGRLPWER